jgi:hypothetical protein
LDLVRLWSNLHRERLTYNLNHHENCWIDRNLKHIDETQTVHLQPLCSSFYGADIPNLPRCKCECGPTPPGSDDESSSDES